MKSFRELSQVKDKVLNSIDDGFDPTLDIEAWQSVQPDNRGGFRGQVLDPMQISLRLTAIQKVAPGKPATHLLVRFGNKLLKQLGLKAGDCVSILHHPNDYNYFIIIKDEKGYKLNVETDRKCVYARFRWENKYKLPTSKSHIIPYGIHEQGYLMFRLPKVIVSAHAITTELA